MLEKLAFVDIETTGTRVTRDRVIEVGIIRVENNKVVDTYHSLFNPQMYMSPYITSFTGITKDELENAPLFADELPKITKLLQDCIFVAHNVRFDYGFLKNEFARFEQPFSPPQLCTLKLSRKLYPSYKKHGLSELIERFNLPCTNRHRAFDDANATWHFYQLASKSVEPDKLETIAKEASRRPSIPTLLKAKDIANLPDSPGIYIFYDTKGYPLYVGKSTNIKTRVQSHFTSDYTSSKEMNMCQQVASIETVTTAGELSALLLESETVKQMQPLYNRQLRHAREVIVAKKQRNEQGYYTVDVETAQGIEAQDIPNIVGIFKSKKQAQTTLLETAKEFSLCHKLLHLEKTSGACFPYQLESCKGACLGKETVAVYNARFEIAFLKSKIRSWPFESPIIIEEYNETDDKREQLIVDQWCIVGRTDTTFFEDETRFQPTQKFDVDTYKILRRFIADPKNHKRIITAKSRIKNYESRIKAQTE